MHYEWGKREKYLYYYMDTMDDIYVRIGNFGQAVVVVIIFHRLIT